MKGNLARSILCSLRTSVDCGLYSWMVGARCDCCVRAIRGHSSAEPAHTMSIEAIIARQDFMRQLLEVNSRRNSFAQELQGAYIDRGPPLIPVKRLHRGRAYATRRYQDRCPE